MPSRKLKTHQTRHSLRLNPTICLCDNDYVGQIDTAFFWSRHLFWLQAVAILLLDQSLLVYTTRYSYDILIVFIDVGAWSSGSSYNKPAPRTSSYPSSAPRKAPLLPTPTPIQPTSLSVTVKSKYNTYMVVYVCICSLVIRKKSSTMLCSSHYILFSILYQTTHQS